MNFCLSFVNLCLSKNLLHICIWRILSSKWLIYCIYHSFMTIFEEEHKNKKNHVQENRFRYWNKNYATTLSGAIYHQSWLFEWVLPFTKLIFLAWPHSCTGILFGQFKSMYTTAIMCSIGRYPWNARKVSP